MASNDTIKLLLADVDGTLVDSDKELTAATIDAVRRLAEAGIVFAITSGRPPRGMAMLVEPLDLKTPVSAFNGGVTVDPHMSVLSQKCLPGDAVDGILELIGSHGLDCWVYSGSDWYVRDPDGPHVHREASTVRFQPTVVDSFGGIDDVVKIVGVCSDHPVVTRAEAAARDAFGDTVSAARSQPYYLDITHPDANKGAVVRYLAAEYGIAPSAMATIGDMPNDVLMFAHSGIGIAMGNSDREVQRAARHVTTGNDDDGFANAVKRYVLRDT